MAATSPQLQALPRFLLPAWRSQSNALRPAPVWRILAADTQSPSSTPRSGPQHHPLSTSTAFSRRHPALSSRRSPVISQTRAFHPSPTFARDHHFDTLKFVSRLKSEGFSEPQAVAMMRVLSDVIEESIQNLTRTMVLREDQEKATYTQKVDFTKLRSELLSSDSTESNLTRASHERLTNDLAKLNSRLRDEIGRTQASVRLDLNLEKGRIREEANVQELKIKETETRIEQEVAGLRERVEGVKFSTLQWLMYVGPFLQCPIRGKYCGKVMLTDFDTGACARVRRH